MRVEVNFESCASTGACVVICPEVFQFDDHGFLTVLAEHPSDGLHEAAREASLNCPTGAIKLLDDADGVED
jgi:ferredoxin